MRPTYTSHESGSKYGDNRMLRVVRLKNPVALPVKSAKWRVVFFILKGWEKVLQWSSEFITEHRKLQIERRPTPSSVIYNNLENWSDFWIFVRDLYEKNAISKPEFCRFFKWHFRDFFNAFNRKFNRTRLYYNWGLRGASETLKSSILGIFVSTFCMFSGRSDCRTTIWNYVFF